MNVHAIMQHISYLLHTCICRYDTQGHLIDFFCARKDMEPAQMQPQELITNFLQDFPSHPYVFCVNEKLLYGIVQCENDILVLGPTLLEYPISLKRCISFELFLCPDDFLNPCHFETLTSCLLLLHNITRNHMLDELDLMRDNCLEYDCSDHVHGKYNEIVFDIHEKGKLHNPYEQEQREMTSISHGNLKSLRDSLLEDHVGELGTLANDPVRNYKNMAIVVITLASRAAIQGGIAYEVAYSLSDSYCQIVEECTDTLTPVQLARDAQFQYAQMVQNLNEEKLRSHANFHEPNWHVRRAIDYISAHLHNRLTVKEIADELGINADYLSHLFRETEGLTLSHFITHEKINRTKNLLIYSSFSYSEIANYLGFATQSHLGSQFKKITGYTLRQYRTKFGKKEN